MDRSQRRRTRKRLLALPMLVGLAAVGGAIAGAASGSFIGESHDGPHQHDGSHHEVEGERNAPVRTGSKVTIAEGPTPGGAPWQLLAYQSDAGVCLELTGVTPANLGGGACGVSLPGESALDVIPDTFGDPSVSFVYGPVDSSVEAVTVEFDDGRSRDVPVRRAPAELGFDGDFYIGVVPGDVRATSVSGRDASGVMVERVPG